MIQPTIKAIETTVFRLSMHGVLHWGQHSTMNDVHHVLVRVFLSDGRVGYAEAPPRPTIYGETVASITSIIRQELAPRVIGLDAHRVKQVWTQLDQVKNNHAAKAAIDIALHDAVAQSRGVSLAEALDVERDKSKQRIQVSYILGIDNPETMFDEAERVFAAGVRVFKVKVGRNWNEDMAILGELQAAFDESLSLYADANECFTVDEAASQLQQLHEMGLLYCEEPLPVELIRERASLRRGNHLPLIADDSAFTTRDLRRELALDTFDILNIKTARTGYTESLQMIEMLQSYDTETNKSLMVGSQASAGLGTARAACLAALPVVNCPSELSFFLKLKEDIVTHHPKIQDGYIDLDDLLSIRIDEDLLREAIL